MAIENKMFNDEDSREKATAISRILSLDDNPIEPFKIEPFCAQMAWMSSQYCPVYPFRNELGKRCEYLTKEEYEGYVCPGNPKELPRIIWSIANRGTPEQKKSLELLGDAHFKYAQNPITIELELQELEEGEFYPEELGGCAPSAYIIFKLLGLEKKASTVREFLGGITQHVEHEWEKRDAFERRILRNFENKKQEVRENGI